MGNPLSCLHSSSIPIIPIIPSHSLSIIPRSKHSFSFTMKPVSILFALSSIATVSIAAPTSVSPGSSSIIASKQCQELTGRSGHTIPVDPAFIQAVASKLLGTEAACKFYTSPNCDGSEKTLASISDYENVIRSYLCEKSPLEESVARKSLGARGEPESESDDDDDDMEEDDGDDDDGDDDDGDDGDSDAEWDSEDDFPEEEGDEDGE